MARDKVLSLISLATKAGRCASGEFLTESETKSGRSRTCSCGRGCIREYEKEVSGYV